LRSSRISARRGLLASAGVLTAMLAAAPVAGAVSYKGGPADFAGLRGGIKVNKATQGAKREGSRGFELPVTGGNATMNTSPSGTLSEGGSVELKLGSKRVTLSQFKETFAAGKVTISARIGGKTVNLFEGTTANKITVAGDFSSLNGRSINLTLTSKGAAALNKAFGLKKPRRGRKDKRFKRRQRIGTKSFAAQRSLTVTGGNTEIIFDPEFRQKLDDCGVTQTAIPPAEQIPDGAPGAPKGGFRVPAGGGTVNAVTNALVAQHNGGVQLSDDDVSADPGAQPFTSQLTAFVIELGPQNTLSATSSITGAPILIAQISGQSIGKTLTDTGGQVTVGNMTFTFDQFAADALGLFYGCQLPPGVRLGTGSGSYQVE
jgi:hypothetical protein